MSDNYNISLDTTRAQEEAAGLNPNNPNMTSVDFANQLSQNAMRQREQEIQVKQAIESYKQAQLSGKQKQEAADLGVNPSLGDYIPVANAVAMLKGAKIDDDAIAQFVAELNGQQMVDSKDVRAIIHKKALSEKAGPYFTATAADAKNPSMLTKEGDQLNAGESYYDTGTKDEEGNAIYAHGGKEPTDPSAKLALKDQQFDEKQWIDLNKELNKFIRSSRGNSLTTAAQRAVRALNELGEGQPLTSQVLSFVQKDLSGIFQGGVPPVAGMEAEDFTNILQKVNHFIGKYTGVQGYLHHDLGDQRQYLLGLLIRLNDSTIAMIKAGLASNAEGYRTLIDKNPEQWQKLVDDKLAAVQAGVSKNAQTTIDASNEGKQGHLGPAMTPVAGASGGGAVEDKKAALRAKLGI